MAEDLYSKNTDDDDDDDGDLDNFDRRNLLMNLSSRLAQWQKVERGRDLFIKGMGGFDVNKAYALALQLGVSDQLGYHECVPRYIADPDHVQVRLLKREREKERRTLHNNAKLMDRDM